MAHDHSRLVPSVDAGMLGVFLSHGRPAIFEGGVSRFEEAVFCHSETFERAEFIGHPSLEFLRLGTDGNSREGGGYAQSGVARSCPGEPGESREAFEGFQDIRRMQAMDCKGKGCLQRTFVG
jgi:hypothetical protein